MNYLGIDLGTTSMKFVLINKDKILYKKSIKYPVIYYNNGYAEQDPVLWLKAFKKLYNNINFHVDKIGITGQMHSLVLTKNGKPLMNSILWSDNRSYNFSKYLIRKFKLKNLILETGNYPLSNFTLLRLLWIRKYNNNIYKNADKAFVAKDWLKFMITKKHGTDVTDGSGTYLFNVKLRKWSDFMFEKLNINNNLFGNYLESKDIHGYFNNIPVIAGAGDQEAAAYGNNLNIKDTGISIGTSGVVFSKLDSYKIPEDKSIHLFCDVEKNKWHWMGVTQSAASSLDWFMNMFKIKYSRLNNIKKFSNVLFLPYLNGERSPLMNINIRSLFFNLSSNTNMDDFLVSIMQGVAFSLKHTYDTMKINKENIILTGGGTKIDYWNQIIANTFNMPVKVKEDSGSALGAALLASDGDIKYYNDYKIYYPENTDLYTNLYIKYKEMVKKVINFNIKN